MCVCVCVCVVRVCELSVELVLHFNARSRLKAAPALTKPSQNQALGSTNRPWRPLKRRLKNRSSFKSLGGGSLVVNFMIFSEFQARCAPRRTDVSEKMQFESKNAMLSAATNAYCSSSDCLQKPRSIHSKIKAKSSPNQ